MIRHFHFVKSLLFSVSIAFLGIGFANAQNNVWNNKINAALQKQEAAVFDLFTLSTERDATLDAAIDNIIYLKLNKEAFEQARTQSNKLIQFTLPVAELNKPVTVMYHDIFADNYRAYTKDANGRRTDITHLVQKGIHYGGIILGEQSSFAAVSFTTTFFNAILSTEFGGNYNLSLNTLNPGENNENYVLYKERDIKNAADYAPHCVTDDLELNQKQQISYGAKPNAGSYPSCKVLKVSLHTDYELYTERNNSVNNVILYLETMFNGNRALFAGEEIESVISETVISTAPDGYNQHSSSDGVLSQFGNDLQASNFNYDGDLVQMITGGNFYHGGLAWLDVLCRTPSYSNFYGTWIGPWSMTNNSATNLPPTFPIYSWDVSASTHEMGHNLGSPHTHSCSWPNVALDNCYPVQGNCSPGPTPTNGGTIMSYCHLAQGVGVNFLNYFGPLPGQLLRDNINDATCMQGVIPEKTLELSMTTVSANKQCQDGDWMHYYHDNNTATDDDDILLLSVNAGGEDLGALGSTEIIMKTTAGYDMSPRSVSAPYAANPLWREINRTWTVNINQPSAVATVRFPFDSVDIKDMKFEYPNVQANQLVAYYFTTMNAAMNPNNASASELQYTTNGSSSATDRWRLGTNGNHYYAEMKMQTIFGGSIGYAPNFSPIHNIARYSTFNVYPNPATDAIVLDLSTNNIASGNQNIQISDQIGRVVLVKDINTQNGKVEINIANLSAGIYTVKYIDEHMTAIAKFAKK